MTSKRRQNNKQRPAQQPTTVTAPKTVTAPAPTKGPARLVILAIAVIISFVFYGNTLKNGYAMDDELVTLNQKNVEQGLAGIPAIFTSRYSVNAKQNYEYRPVVLVSFAIEYQFFGRNPAASHFFNVLLYALLGFLVYTTMARLFPQQHWWLPVLCMLLFLVHPLHSEVVASLKNRDEILALIFSLLSLNAFMTYAEKRKWTQIGLGILFFLLGILSKKSCLPFVFIIPFTLWYVYRTNLWRTLLFSAGAIVLAGLTYLAFRKLMLPEKTGSARDLLFFENPLYEGKHGLGQLIMMSLGTFGYYIKMAFVPYPLVVYYGYNTFDGFNFGLYHIIGIAGFVVLCWLMYRYYRTSKPIFMGALFFIASISMFTNLVKPAVGIVAERFAFESSLWFSLLVAMGILAVFKSFQSDHTAQGSGGQVKKHRNIQYTALVLLVISAIVVIPRNTNWENHFTIYNTDIKKVPKSAKLNSLLGTHYANRIQGAQSNRIRMDQAQYQRSIDSSIYFFSRALAVYPQYTAVINNLGTIYINYKNDPDSSLKYFMRAIDLDSKYMEAQGNYAIAMEAIADRTSEKLSWINTLPLAADSLQEGTTALKKLDQYNAVFLVVSQMKSNFLQRLNSGLSTQQPTENLRPGLQNLSAQYATMISGRTQPGADHAAWLNALMAGYEQVKNSGRFERMGEVIDSVTAVYFYPMLTSMVPAETRKMLNTSTQLALQKQVKDSRKDAVDHYKKALELKNDNVALYQKAMTTLTKWGMMDELISVHQLVMGAKYVRRYSLELNIARAYFTKKDWTNGYVHTQKALDEMEKVLQRTKTCMNDFTQAGNQYAINYFEQSAKRNKAGMMSFVGSCITQLQQQQMNTEAGQLQQRMTGWMK